VKSISDYTGKQKQCQLHCFMSELSGSGDEAVGLRRIYDFAILIADISHCKFREKIHEGISARWEMKNVE
jgi:hypothetical protein